jgi:non-heme chloroperoxidase
VEFVARDGITLRGDAFGDPTDRPVVLLHGGGQTRHAWSETGRLLAEDGWQAIALDLRGHGDSDWSKDRAYRFDDFAADVLEILPALLLRPVLVGASLGGLAALIAAGQAGSRMAGLVLVDVAPQIESEGAMRILEFMRGHPNGFASLEECAEAVFAYNPHRARPKDPSGLEKNLRLGADGRWRWHWDPGFLGIDRRGPDREGQLRAAAQSLAMPTLLVRGRQSDLLSEEGARDFLGLVPHARYADVTGAGHMVAGDRNDLFTQAVRTFLRDEIAPTIGARVD